MSGDDCRHFTQDWLTELEKLVSEEMCRAAKALGLPDPTDPDAEEEAPKHENSAAAERTTASRFIVGGQYEPLLSGWSQLRLEMLSLPANQQQRIGAAVYEIVLATRYINLYGGSLTTAAEIAYEQARTTYMRAAKAAHKAESSRDRLIDEKVAAATVNGAKPSVPALLESINSELPEGERPVSQRTIYRRLARR